jgi:hypothetical protein
VEHTGSTPTSIRSIFLYESRTRAEKSQFTELNYAYTTKTGMQLWLVRVIWSIKNGLIAYKR